jgi:hypothetical protein
MVQAWAGVIGVVDIFDNTVDSCAHTNNAV